jgi:hypothetical protein
MTDRLKAEIEARLDQFGDAPAPKPSAPTPGAYNVAGAAVPDEADGTIEPGSTVRPLSKWATGWSQGGPHYLLACTFLQRSNGHSSAIVAESEKGAEVEAGQALSICTFASAASYPGNLRALVLPEYRVPAEMIGRELRDPLFVPIDGLPAGCYTEYVWLD